MQQGLVLAQGKEQPEAEAGAEGDKEGRPWLTTEHSILSSSLYLAQLYVIVSDNIQQAWAPW